METTPEESKVEQPTQSTPAIEQKPSFENAAQIETLKREFQQRESLLESKLRQTQQRLDDEISKNRQVASALHSLE